MNRKTILSLTVSASLCLAGLALAGDMDMAESAAPTTQPTAATEAVDVGNTICPVSGDNIGDSKIVEVYDGKVYHLCCSDCPDEFKKNPEKYAKAIADNPAKYGVKK